MNTLSFLPNQELLQSIKFQHQLPIIFIFPTLNLKKNKEEAMRDISYVTIIKSLLTDHYKERYTHENSQYILVNIFHEPLRNAMEYGNKFDRNSHVAVALWMGEKGVLFAFRDIGDYFSKESVKNLYESRSHIKSTRTTEIGGAGTRCLYDQAEDIIISTEENTLYVSYLLKDS